MDAAILCPGPSLGSWPVSTFDGHSLRIGVNRAITFAKCDWWAFGDDTMFSACPDVAGVSIFTTREAFRRINKSTAAERFRGFSVSLYEDRQSIPLDTGWAIFTATAALVLAASLGATSIDVYGSDWTDQPDWDGGTLETNRRTADRWETEQVIWWRVCDWLQDAGVTVTRLQPTN